MNNHTPKSLTSADLQWRDGQPISTQFDDVYYSTDDGLAESRYVFVAGNQLSERWQQLKDRASGNRVFTIGETGFGTGLNFLAAADLWLRTAPADHQLHFVSVEKYPLTRHQLEQALAHWTELESLSRSLIASYPPLVSGLHSVWLYEGRVRLTLIFDDAVEGLSELMHSSHPAFKGTTGNRNRGRIDAWFLDGFAPSKNPDLWSPQLFDLMSQLSGENTSYATFTVARIVRDGLQEAGFSLEKQPGFGRKRDMLRGRFLHEAGTPHSTHTAQKNPETPRVLRNSKHESTWHLNLTTGISSNKKALVIGAGIAGCTTAAALKKRGWNVTLVDRNGLPGQEASGNPQGILYPKLSVENSPLSRFGLNSLAYAVGFYGDYWAASKSQNIDSAHRGAKCGVLVLPESDKDISHFNDIGQRFSQSSELVQLIKGNELAAKSGVPLAHDLGLWFPNLGWVCPPQVCAEISEGIPLIQAEVASIQKDDNNESWLLLDAHGKVIEHAPQVIIASSNQSKAFSQCDHLPLRPVRGQISTLGASEASLQLKTVLCGTGYLAPASDFHHTLGATYSLNDDASDLRQADHAANLENLAKTDNALPCLWPQLDIDQMQGRAAVRCTTPDYLPIAGPAPDKAKMQQDFADFRRNAKADIPLPGAYLPGLWLNCGHGSRGLTYAPMVAELLASQINNELLPIARTLLPFLNPARFIIRDIKRGV